MSKNHVISFLEWARGTEAGHKFSLIIQGVAAEAKMSYSTQLAAHNEQCQTRQFKTSVTCEGICTEAEWMKMKR